MTSKPERLFGRLWRVTVGPAGGQGRSWEGLRVAFKIEKHGDATPNTADVTITNLSPESRAYIKKGMALRLEAGYEGTGMKLLFTGAIQVPESERVGADWQTRLQAGDGVREYRSTVISESFGPKTSEGSVIKAIADKMGLTIGELKGLSDEKYAQGRSLSGPARSHLDRLCASRGLRWSIQDGALQIIPAGQGLSGSAVVLSPATGLVGTPKHLPGGGYRVVSLLQGGINPGRVITLESATAKGSFVAEVVEHDGDSHGAGASWTTTIDLVPIR
ncbi:hypothetical protein D3C72_1298780 [compost metagenome]